MNHSSLDKQPENDQLQVQSVDNQYKNIKPKKKETGFHTREIEIEKNDKSNKNFLENLKSLEDFDFDPLQLKYILKINSSLKF